MAESNEIPGMGWLRDYPDFRDYTMDASVVSNRLKLSGETNSIKVMLTKVGVAKPQKARAAGFCRSPGMVLTGRRPEEPGVVYGERGCGRGGIFREGAPLVITSMLPGYSSIRRRVTCWVGQETPAHFYAPPWPHWCCSVCRRKATGLTMSRISIRSRRASYMLSPKATMRSAITGSILQELRQPRC